jgi:hypothetical protein
MKLLETPHLRAYILNDAFPFSSVIPSERSESLP